MSKGVKMQVSRKNKSIKKSSKSSKSSKQNIIKKKKLTRIC